MIDYPNLLSPSNDNEIKTSNKKDTIASEGYMMQLLKRK